MSAEFLTEIQTESQKQLHSIPAKRLKDKLLPIASKQNEMARRWFWELLQNASDYNEQVHVRLTLNNKQLIFSHSGNPFRTVDVLNVIAPDSGKDADELDLKENIGKFGSGLISTHILSSLITVEGVAQAKDNGLYYGFKVNLDRSQPQSKDFLMESIKKTREEFERNYEPIEYKKGTFQTQFAYHLNRPFGEIDGEAIAITGIKHIIEILPYTLCFMPKILSVEIVNQSDKFDHFSTYKMEHGNISGDQIKFKKIVDKESVDVSMLLLTHGDASTAVQILGNKLVSYPRKITKLFCGLPLTGTEQVGLPIIVNSLEFNPGAERDAIELSPRDTKNQKVLLDAAELYKKLLDRLIELKVEDLYHISRIRTKYEGVEASKIWFKNYPIKLFVNHLQKAQVVKNGRGEYITLAETKIPTIDKEYIDDFYEVASLFAYHKTPCKASFKPWLDTIDFNLFTNTKYEFQRFLSEVVQTKELASFILFDKQDTTRWLQQILSLLTDVDDNLLNKYELFPNQKGRLMAKSDIDYQQGFMPDLMAINNEVNSECIEETLLHDDFKMLEPYLGASKLRNMSYLCKRIDDGLKQLYKKHDGDPTPFVTPLRKLFSWYNTSLLPEKERKELFVWFSAKRAILFLETFSEQERDLALNIAQSGKMQALARLANSDISMAQLSSLADKVHLIDKILLALQEEVDDHTHANEATGDIGEELIYKDLQKQFPSYQGYKVIWSSKELNEARFDFEVTKNDETFWYVDAKTTVRGMHNADSIPFFMRNAQWDFLQTIEAKEKYLIARVFLGGETSNIKYININTKENIK
jgi:hypothetical protein